MAFRLSLDWTLWLLFISMRNFVRLLFDSDYYLRAALIKLGTEDEEIHWLQMPGRQSKETLPCTLATATDTELEE